MKQKKKKKKKYNKKTEKRVPFFIWITYFQLINGGKRWLMCYSDNDWRVDFVYVKNEIEMRLGYTTVWIGNAGMGEATTQQYILEWWEGITTIVKDIQIMNF